MSALVTHLLIGALVALALRWEWKWVPLGMLLAELPDLDHFFGLQPRVHLHNLAFVLVLPLAVLAYLVALDVRSRVDAKRSGLAVPTLFDTPIRLAAGAPALMSAHLVLVALPDFGGSHLALLYPLSDRVFTFDIPVRHAIDPFAWSTLSVALLDVVALVAVGHSLRAASFRATEALAARASVPVAHRIPVRIGSAARHLHHAEPEPEVVGK